MAETATKKRRTKTKAPGVYRSISGRYEIAYRDSDGRQVFKTLDANVDYQRAKQLRADIVSTMGRGGKIRTVQPTFGSYAEVLIDALDAPESTIEKHRYHVRSHLKPRFEARRLDEIDADKVARVVTAMKRKGYAGSTIAGTLSTLSLVMGKAVRAGYAPTNPVRQLDKDERPRVEHPEKRVLDHAEIERLLAAAGETFRPVVATMLFTGLRLAEVLGLRWQDIDRENRYIHVTGQLSRRREVRRLKTKAARRDVILLTELDGVLLEHRMRSPYKAPTDFVFTTPEGKPRGHRTTSRGVEGAVARAGLGDGISSHNFRHTYASHLIVGLKLDPVTVARLIGHSKASTTQDIYAREYAKVRHDDQTRELLSAGYGSVFGSVNVVSTAAGNGPQLRGPGKLANVPLTV